MNYLSTAQAAIRIGVSDSTVRRRIREGEITFHDIGTPGRSRLRISEADLQRYVESVSGEPVAS